MGQRHFNYQSVFIETINYFLSSIIENSIHTLLFIIYVVLFNISKWQCRVFKFQCLDVQELTFNYPGERRVKLCWII